MTATQVKDKALSILDEFEEGEVTLQSVHYCQVINPANVSEPRFRTSKCSIKKYIVLKSPKIIPGQEYFSFH